MSLYNKKEILALAGICDSFYFYDETALLHKISLLKEGFQNARFLYSIKANHNPALASIIFSQGFGADAASLKEVLLAHDAGLPEEAILYSAPAKTRKDLEGALGKAIIIADSLSELEKLQDICAAKNMVVPIGVRINPDFTLTADHGAAGKFGIDEEALFAQAGWINSLKNLRIKGIHVHVKSQELDGKLLANYYENVFRLAMRFEEAFKTSLLFINFGSGIGTTYSPADKPVSVQALGKTFQLISQRYASRFAHARLLIETGRYITNDCGLYATKVLDKKQSRGKTFVLLKNTLNGCIRPALAEMMAQDAPSWEPLYTKKDAFEIIALSDSPDKETVTLAGNLCTATDIIATDITLPVLHEDDVIVITHVGSYTAVLSPMQFASQEKPGQYLLRVDKSIINIGM